MYIGKLYNKHPQKIKYFTRRTITGMCYVRQKEGKKRQNVAAIATALTPKVLTLYMETTRNQDLKTTWLFQNKRKGPTKERQYQYFYISIFLITTS